MGDRLTLETAAPTVVEFELSTERWRLVLYDGGTSVAEVNRGPDALGRDTWTRARADDWSTWSESPTAVLATAVRAYRERLPASDEGCECGSAVIWHNRRRGSCKTCGSMHTRERLPDDAPECERCSQPLTPGQVLDGWTVHPDCEQGPTEGASDAGPCPWNDKPTSEGWWFVWGASPSGEDDLDWHPVWVSEDAGWDIGYSWRNDGERSSTAGFRWGGRVIMPGERPPTGEASPGLAALSKALEIMKVERDEARKGQGWPGRVGGTVGPKPGTDQCVVEIMTEEPGFVLVTVMTREEDGGDPDEDRVAIVSLAELRSALGGRCTRGAPGLESEVRHLLTVVNEVSHNVTDESERRLTHAAGRMADVLAGRRAALNPS